MSSSVPPSVFSSTLTEASTDTTYTAFIDTKCKIQDVYDEVSAEMLDLTLQNVAYDVVAITDTGLWSLIANNIPEFKTNVYKRLWDTKAQKSQEAIDQLISMYQNM